jgi:hypothetical protein
MRRVRTLLSDALNLERASRITTLLVNGSAQLVDGPWSPRFVKPRLIVPGDLVFPDLFYGKQIVICDGKGPPSLLA